MNELEGIKLPQRIEFRRGKKGTGAQPGRFHRILVNDGAIVMVEAYSPHSALEKFIKVCSLELDRIHRLTGSLVIELD